MAGPVAAAPGDAALGDEDLAPPGDDPEVRPRGVGGGGAGGGEVLHEDGAAEDRLHEGAVLLGAAGGGGGGAQGDRGWQRRRLEDPDPVEGEEEGPADPLLLEEGDGGPRVLEGLHDDGLGEGAEGEFHGLGVGGIGVHELRQHAADPAEPAAGGGGPGRLLEDALRAAAHALVAVAERRQHVEAGAGGVDRPIEGAEPLADVGHAGLEGGGAPLLLAEVVPRGGGGLQGAGGGGGGLRGGGEQALPVGGHRPHAGGEAGAAGLEPLLLGGEAGAGVGGAAAALEDVEGAGAELADLLGAAAGFGGGPGDADLRLAEVGLAGGDGALGLGLGGHGGAGLLRGLLEAAEGDLDLPLVPGDAALQLAGHLLRGGGPLDGRLGGPLGLAGLGLEARGPVPEAGHPALVRGEVPGEGGEAGVHLGLAGGQLPDPGRGRLALLEEAGVAPQPHLDAPRADLELQGAVPLGAAGLGPHGAELLLAHGEDVAQADEVLVEVLDAPLGLLLAEAVAGDAGGLLEDEAALDGVLLEDGVDLALLEDGQRAAAAAGVHEQLADVLQAGLVPVEQVLAGPVPEEAPGEDDLVEVHGEEPVLVVEGEGDLGEAERLAPPGAGEEHVRHLGAPHGGGPLLAEGPLEGVHDVGLPAAVGAHDSRHPPAEVELHPVGEGLETEGFEALEMHEFSVFGIYRVSPPPPERPFRASAPCAPRPPPGKAESEPYLTPPPGRGRRRPRIPASTSRSPSPAAPPR